MNKILDRNRAGFLDGIRGWAAVIVLLDHIMVQFLSKINPAFNSVYYRFFTDGGLAVYVFFVLSGYALSISFIKNNDTLILTELALRRYIRLTIPILASSCIAYLLMKYHLFFNVTAASLINDKFWLGTHYLFDPSFYKMLKFSLLEVYFRYSGLTTYNENLWTMQYELYGSFIVFALLALVYKLKRKWLIYLIMLFALDKICQPLESFMLGILLAEISQFDFVKKQRDSLLFFLLGAVFLSFGAYASYALRNLYDPRHLSYFAASIVFATVLSKKISDLFENKISRFLGSISFPLYLTHVIVICSLSSFVYIYLIKNSFSLMLASNITFVITIFSCILFAFCFRPVERLSIKLARIFSSFLIEDKKLEFTFIRDFLRDFRLLKFKKLTFKNESNNL